MRMRVPTPFSDVPVLGKMPLSQAVAKLRELGEDEAAKAVESTAQRSGYAPEPSGLFKTLLRPKPWQHTAHVLGFLPVGPPGTKPLQIQHAGNIAPEKQLRNARLKISLNRLRVASYPGRGIHRILFDFYAQNQISGSMEELHFNSTVRAQDGEHAAVVGYPIFVGLNVGTEGVAFRCYTVNVKNEADVGFLNFLESDVAKTGLRLATVVQPSLGPFVKLAMGITKSIAQRNQNVPVQDFFLGLDFDETRMGARLAQGDYIAVQVSESLQTAWNWSEWVYSPSIGQIVRKESLTELIPYNYLVFSVSRYIET